MEKKEKKYQISKECFTCGACAGVCPIHCIEHTAFDRYRIHTDECIGCGICTTVCPATAIHEV